MKAFKINTAGAVQSLTSFRATANEVPQIEAPSTANQLRLNGQACQLLGVDYLRLSEGGQFVDLARVGDTMLNGVTYADAFVIFMTDGDTGAKLAQPSKALGGPLIFSNANVYINLKGRTGQDEEGNIQTAVWNIIPTPVVGISETGAVALEDVKEDGYIVDNKWVRDFEATGNVAGDEVTVGYLVTFNEFETKPGRPSTAGRTAPKKGAQKATAEFE